MSDLLIDDGGRDPVRRLAHRWVLSTARNGEYFHLARSAQLFPNREGGQRLSVSVLCGPSFSDPILVDEPQGPMCGTCAGRWLGIRDDPFAFRPRSVRTLPKRWCAGSRNRWAVDDRGQRLSRCLACGQMVGWWGDGLRQHEHNGRGIACPEHGSRSLSMTNAYRAGPNVMVCWGHSHDDQGRGERCRQTPRPFWIIPSHEGGSIR